MNQQFYCTAKAPLVKTISGPVRGFHYNGLDIFKGIPYGRARRFHAPEPMPAWETALDATSFGCVCPLMEQEKPKGELLVPHRYWVQDEDCLNLNVWTPACDDARRPVLVWLHGGGYFAGSAIEHIAYEGENMARLGDCVVVSINHRLNILGYLDLSDFGDEYINSGNAGGDDIILALRWVHENIAAFGGDPGCVTVFGQSGGGAKVTTLMQSPAADGLFQRGFIMSGVIGDTLADCKGSGRKCVEALMAKLHISTVAELETVSYAHLAAAYKKVSPSLKAEGLNVGTAPHPNDFYLGDPLTNGSGFRPETADIPLLVGTVFSEFQGFTDPLYSMTPEEIFGEEDAIRLRSLFKAAYPHRDSAQLPLVDTIFRAPTIQYIQERAKAGGSVYSYLFEQDFPIDGGHTAWHCADIPFVFHNTCLVPVCAFDGAEALEERIFQAVLSFARTGNPGWIESTAKTENTMLFGTDCHVVSNHDHALIQALQPLTGQIFAAMSKGAGQIQH
ncbi:MAG: carboxylesterase family protein [Clostridiales bacterium]|nr:carboxylesterase family protein [Clostridiales bacterium]